MDLPALGGLSNPPHSSAALLFVAGGRALAGSEHVTGKRGERKEKEGRSEITQIIGSEASGAAAGCGVHLSVSPSSFPEPVSAPDLPRAGVN